MSYHFLKTAAIWILGAYSLLMLSSCGWLPPKLAPQAKPVMYEWHDDGGLGDVSIEIDLSRQMATYQRGRRTIGWSFVSTGKEGHATATGSYVIMEKIPVKISDRYGWIADEAGNVTNGNAKPTTPVPLGHHYSGAPMHYWMRITSYGVGMHAGEIPKPGEASSHGCIRLPRDFVPKLYEVVRIGTPVKIICNRLKPRAHSPGGVTTTMRSTPRLENSSQ
jgi:L,D-transpeptidase catalytic domain